MVSIQLITRQAQKCGQENIRGFSRLLVYINHIVAGELMLVEPIKMNHAKTKQVEAVLKQYPYFNLLERERRTEIEQSKGEIDENVGGGRSGFSENHAHENKAIKFSDDVIISTIRHNRATIDKFLSQLDDYQIKIIEMSYFQRFNRYDVVKIAKVANVSRATVFRFRKRFVAQLYTLLKL